MTVAAEEAINTRHNKARTLLHKLHLNNCRVLVLPNGSIRVGDADTGEAPPEKFQRLIVDYRFELKGLCTPKRAEEEDLWPKALRTIAKVLHDAGISNMPVGVYEALEKAQEVWEGDNPSDPPDVGGGRFYLTVAYMRARAAAEEVGNAA